MIRPAQGMFHQIPIPRPEQPQMQNEYNQPPQMQQQQPINGEIRIHLQRIPLTRDESIQVRQIPYEVIQARPNMIREIPAVRLQSVVEREHQPNFPSREAALLRESFGLTSEDLMNIQRLAQERIEQEIRSLQEEGMSNDSNSSENDEDEDNSEENMMNLAQPQPRPIGKYSY